MRQTRETRNPKNHHNNEHVVIIGFRNYHGHMRSDALRSIVEHQQSANHERLTTGEAARLLNSSRQHIVDLCNKGHLPYETVGTHRRVRRSDVEAIRDRTLRMTRDQGRSLRLAYATAGRIAMDPAAARSIARANLELMQRSARGQATVWLDEWSRLLEAPTDELLGALTSTSQFSRELRQNSPFAGVLSEGERESALAAWRTEWDAGRRSSIGVNRRTSSELPPM